MTAHKRTLSTDSSSSASSASRASTAPARERIASSSSFGSLSSSPTTPPQSPTYPPRAALSADAPLRPLPGWSFTFPRPADGPLPPLPISGLGPSLWAARVGSARWRRGSISADVFTWAIVDSVLDRTRVVQTSRRVLPGWNEWLYLTDQLVFDAWEAAVDALAHDAPTDIRAVGRLCRTVVNWTWSPWHDSAPPPKGYRLRRPVPRDLMGECDPRKEENRGIVCELAGREGRGVKWEVACGSTLLLKIPLQPPRAYPRLDRRVPPKRADWECHAPRTSAY